MLTSSSQILGYIVQLTENDTTQDMPSELPENFFIPDADYDAVTADTGAGTNPVHTVNPEEGKGSSEGPKAPVVQPSNLLDQIDTILKDAKLPADTMNLVNGALAKELGIISKDLASRVLS